MLDRDWNHPSIVIMSIINEAWGVKGLRDAQERAWLKDAFDRLKQKASPSGRLVVDNSACCQNFHVKTDIADFHQYYSIPDRARDWDKWVAELATRPAWLFSKTVMPKTAKSLYFPSLQLGLLAVRDLAWWFDRDFGGRDHKPAGVFD
jgi:hypothetical protein